MKKLVIVGLFFISHFSIYSEVGTVWYNRESVKNLSAALIALQNQNAYTTFYNHQFLENLDDNTINELALFITVEKNIKKLTTSNNFADTYQSINQLAQSINSFSQEAKSKILDFYKENLNNKNITINTIINTMKTKLITNFIEQNTNQDELNVDNINQSIDALDNTTKEEKDSLKKDIYETIIKNNIKTIKKLRETSRNLIELNATEEIARTAIEQYFKIEGNEGNISLKNTLDAIMNAKQGDNISLLIQQANILLDKPGQKSTAPNQYDITQTSSAGNNKPQDKEPNKYNEYIDPQNSIKTETITITRSNMTYNMGSAARNAVKELLQKTPLDINQIGTELANALADYITTSEYKEEFSNDEGIAVKRTFTQVISTITTRNPEFDVQNFVKNITTAIEKAFPNSTNRIKNTTTKFTQLGNQYQMITNQYDKTVADKIQSFSEDLTKTHDYILSTFVNEVSEIEGLQDIAQSLLPENINRNSLNKYLNNFNDFIQNVISETKGSKIYIRKTHDYFHDTNIVKQAIYEIGINKAADKVFTTNKFDDIKNFFIDAKVIISNQLKYDIKDNGWLKPIEDAYKTTRDNITSQLFEKLTPKLFEKSTLTGKSLSEIINEFNLPNNVNNLEKANKQFKRDIYKGIISETLQKINSLPKVKDLAQDTEYKQYKAQFIEASQEYIQYAETINDEQIITKDIATDFIAKSIVKTVKKPWWRKALEKLNIIKETPNLEADLNDALVEESRKEEVDLDNFLKLDPTTPEGLAAIKEEATKMYKSVEYQTVNRRKVIDLIAQAVQNAGDQKQQRKYLKTMIFDETIKDFGLNSEQLNDLKKAVEQQIELLKNKNSNTSQDTEPNKEDIVTRFLSLNPENQEDRDLIKIKFAGVYNEVKMNPNRLQTVLNLTSKAIENENPAFQEQFKNDLITDLKNDGVEKRILEKIGKQITPPKRSTLNVDSFSSSPKDGSYKQPEPLYGKNNDTDTARNNGRGHELQRLTPDQNITATKQANQSQEWNQQHATNNLTPKSGNSGGLGNATITGKEVPTESVYGTDADLTPQERKALEAQEAAEERGGPKTGTEPDYMQIE